MAAVETVSQPYVGPTPFRREDRDRFFGRDAEINDLLSRVIANRTVLFYSPSGAGKTSLLNAGLIPALEVEGFEVLPIARPGGTSNTPPKSAPRNAFVYNLLSSWSAASDGEPAAQRTLTEYLRLRPRQLDENGQPTPRVLIFDQFEELFFLYPDRLQDREDFFWQLRDAMSRENDPLLRVLFSMREEYIGQLIDHEQYGEILPERVRTRFLMGRMTQAQAIQAMTLPLAHALPRRTFRPDAAEHLAQKLAAMRVLSYADKTVTSITGSYIEAVQLQVVCRRLWAMLPPDVSEITLAHVDTLADVTQALQAFYEDVLARIITRTGVREGDLRLWIERNLITVSGTRGLIEKGLETTDGLPNTVLDLMEDLYLIRGDQRRPGSIWVELTHDRLIEPIQLSNNQWGQQHRNSERIRQQLIDRAQEWNQRTGERLTGKRLREARAWKQSQPAEFNALDALTRHYFNRSLRRARLNRGVAAAVVIVLFSLAAAILLNRESTLRDASSPQIAFAASMAVLGEANQPYSVAAFSLDRYEVSVKQYRLCADYGPCQFPAALQNTALSDDQPVTWVNQDNAAEFCGWIGRRLPTVSEWERAARGTDGRLWPWGEQPPDPARVNLQFPEVGFFPGQTVGVDSVEFIEGNSPEGIQHLVGNVSEWTGTPSSCADLYACTAAETTQVLAGAYEVRGFGYTDDLRAYDSAVQLAVPNSFAADMTLDSLGFRCASDP